MRERPPAVSAKLGRMNANPRGRRESQRKGKGPRYTTDGSTEAGGPTLPSTPKATLIAKTVYGRPRGLRTATCQLASTEYGSPRSVVGASGTLGLRPI